MINYTKVVIASLIVSLLSVTAGVLYIKSTTSAGSFGAAAYPGELTTVSNPWDFTNTRTGITMASSTITSLIVNGTTTINGVEIFTRNTALTTSTTTPWAVQPTASSTLIAAWCNITGSTTASTLTLAKSSTRYSTTTVHATSSIAANAQGTINALATTTQNATLGATAVNDRSYGPADWTVFSIEGGIGHFSPTGGCLAIYARP